MRVIQSPSRLVFILLGLFSALFAIFSPPVGYAWDSWNFIYTGVFGEGFFQPGEYLQDYWLRLRPLQYLFDVYLPHQVFNLWLFPKLAHFLTLLYATAFALCFGMLLEKIFPREPLFVALISVFTFFYAPAFASTSILHHNSMYFSAIAFCLTGVLLVNFSKSRSLFPAILWGVGAVACYFLSVFIEELFIVSIFAFPVLVYFAPGATPSTTIATKVKHVMLRAILPVTGMLAGVLFIKYQMIQYIGEQTNFSVLVGLDRLWRFLVMDAMYQVEAFRHVTRTNYRYLALLLLIAGFLLIRRYKPNVTSQQGGGVAAFLVGGSLFFLGRVPFMVLQNYTIDPLRPDYFTGRHFSSIFGFILMVSSLWFLKKNTYFHRIYQFFLIALLACNIAYGFMLADGWKEAGKRQKILYASMLEVCPDVQDHASILFLLDAYVNSQNNKAMVFHGKDSIYTLTQIMYHNQTVQGRIVFSDNITERNPGKTTIITPDYIQPPQTSTVLHEAKIPVNMVILLKVSNDQVELIDFHNTDPLNAIWAESYFEFTRSAFQGLLDNGLPLKVKDQLNPLKGRAFFKDDFLQAVEDHIGRENMLKYQELLLKYTWNWTETYFEFTEQHWQRLQTAGVLDVVLELLQELKGRTFVRDEDFLWEVADRISNKLTDEYRELLVDHEWKPVETITEVKSNTHLIKQTRVDNEFIKYLSKLPD